MNIAHGALFVAHLVASLAATVILVVMRSEAKGRLTAHSVARETPPRNMAARLFHLIPVTGALVIVTSGGDIRWSEAWIGIGMALYLAGAAVLEARALPAERRGEDLAVMRNVEWSLVLLALAALVMLIQF